MALVLLELTSSIATQILAPRTVIQKVFNFAYPTTTSPSPTQYLVFGVYLFAIFVVSFFLTRLAFSRILRISTKALLPLTLLALMTWASAPTAHASSCNVNPCGTVTSPTGSFLGTQTITDTFTCPSTSTTWGQSANWGNTAEGWYGVGGGVCPTQAQMWGQAVSGNLDGGSDIQYYDAGQEGGAYGVSLPALCWNGQTGCSATCSTSTGCAGTYSYQCTSGSDYSGSGYAPCWTFYVPNYGQSTTPVDVSTDVYVLGGIFATAAGTCQPIIGCYGNAFAKATFSITLQILNVQTNNQWSFQPINDIDQCSTTGSACGPVSSVYQQDYTPNSCKLTCSSTYNLPPGYYKVSLILHVETSTGVSFGTTFAKSYTCFFVTSDTSGANSCQYGAQATNCPSGVLANNGSCQYLQWKWVQFTFHFPDFSVSNIPSSMSVNACSSTSAGLVVNSMQIQNSNAYSLSTPISLPASSDDSILALSVSPSPVTPSAGGSVATTLYVSSNICDGGSHLITLNPSVSDGNSNPLTYTIINPLTGSTDTHTEIASPQTHTFSIPILISRQCSFALSASPSSLSEPIGNAGTSTITVKSLNGFTGTVTLSISVHSPSPGYSIQAYFPSYSSTWTIAGGSGSVTLTVLACISTTTGTYTVTVTGADSSGLVSNSTSIPVTITSGSCSGGGGSVAAGTLITLADGSQVPVQNLAVGTQLLSYNVTSQQYVVTTINRFTTVQVNNLMLIQTGSGPGLRVDQNPAQKVWVKLPNGTITLMSVTDLQISYDLFEALSQTWVPITGISYTNHGQYVMYDIYTTAPGNYVANGYLDPNK